MKEPLTVSIKEGAALGLSKVVRKAEERGLVIVKRSGTGVALIMPLTFAGIGNLMELMQGFIDSPKVQETPGAVAAIQFAMQQMIEGVRKNQSEDTALRGRNRSADVVEGKGRRRRSSSASPPKRNPPAKR